MINSQNFNEQNPMFYAYVEMLGALVKEGVLKTSSDSKSTLLLYKTNLPTTFTQGTPLEGKTEGWVAENIFSVAQHVHVRVDVLGQQALRQRRIVLVVGLVCVMVGSHTRFSSGL